MKIFGEKYLIVIETLMFVRGKKILFHCIWAVPKLFTSGTQLIMPFSKSGTAGGQHDCAFAMRGNTSSPLCPCHLSGIKTKRGMGSSGPHRCRREGNAVLDRIIKGGWQGLYRILSLKWRSVAVHCTHGNKPSDLTRAGSFWNTILSVLKTINSRQWVA